MDYAEVLGKVSLFALMKRGDLKKLAKNCSEHEFEVGQIITREGDTDGRLFVIVSGRVEVVKDLDGPGERLAAELGPGKYFGEMALVDDFTRTASIRTLGPVTAISLDQWNFREAIQKYPAIAVEMLQMLARRVRAVEEQLV